MSLPGTQWDGCGHEELSGELPAGSSDESGHDRQWARGGVCRNVGSRSFPIHECARGAQPRGHPHGASSHQ